MTEGKPSIREQFEAAKRAKKDAPAEAVEPEGNEVEPAAVEPAAVEPEAVETKAPAKRARAVPPPRELPTDDAAALQDAIKRLAQAKKDIARITDVIRSAAGI
jgi:hypothetical protein